MTIYQVLCLIGVPTLILAVFKYLWSQIKHNTEDSKALKAGIQALLRAQMISDFNKYSEKGYAPIYARDNFENCWKQYHSLGVNGVMDDLHRKFLELPTDPPGRMSRRTKKPKREFSKLILYVVGAVTVGVTAFTLIMVWKTENLEPLAYLIPAIFAELATATGFYYSKAKAENRIKLRKLYGPEIYNDAKEI